MTKKVKTKLPKEIAGVKIPKALREGDWMDNLLGSETGRQILADALVAAAGAAAAVVLSHRPKVKKMAEAASDAIRNVANRTAGAVAKDVKPARRARKTAKSEETA
ncbi:hypothetical protein HI113_44735, partial [Corallococcus exiguus]|uniref:hypothetical protein n=1 Tax=Corallococcus exiguus TaxID=83462 RepID=UPI001472D62A